MSRSFPASPLQKTATGLLKAGWAASLTFVVLTSLSPGAELPARFWNADKVFHFLGYSWLAFLPLLALARKQAGLRLALSMIGVGFGLELCQAFIPGRFLSMGDIAANTLGVLAGLWLGLRLRPAWMRMLDRQLRSGTEDRLKS